jgi:hypothetical protein
MAPGKYTSGQKGKIKRKKFLVKQVDLEKLFQNPHKCFSVCRWRDFFSESAICIAPENPVQRGFGDLECPANLCNRVSFLIEITGNTQLFPGEGFWSAAFSSSRSGSNQACLCSLFDQVSLKLR